MGFFTHPPKAIARFLWVVAVGRFSPKRVSNSAIFATTFGVPISDRTKSNVSDAHQGRSFLFIKQGL
jgi:hypothetical protein